MTNKTIAATERPYTVVFREAYGDSEVWHVFAATSVEALGRAQAYALEPSLDEGLDITDCDLDFEVVSVTEGHNAELLYDEVHPVRDRKAIDAAMRAALEAEGYGEAEGYEDD
jgi:hypothetical protein